MKQNRTKVKLELFSTVKPLFYQPFLSSLFPKTILHHAADEEARILSSKIGNNFFHDYTYTHNRRSEIFSLHRLLNACCTIISRRFTEL